MIRTWQLGIVCLSLMLVRQVEAGVALSFTPDSTEVNLGDTVNVDIVLTQTMPMTTAPPDPPSPLNEDGVTAFQVPFTLPVGSNFSVSSFAVGSNFTNQLSTSSVLQGFSVIPVTGTSVTLGTYTLTANSVGTTMIATSDTIFTNFSFDSGNTNDSGIVATFSSPSITAVPEPSAFLFLGLLGLSSSGRAYFRNRRRAFIEGDIDIDAIV